MELGRRHELAKSICNTFNNTFLKCYVRFGRTVKIKTEFYAVVAGISWVYSKRKGGGFTIWLLYKENEARPHNVVLKDMVNDYSNYIDNLILIGKNLKEVKNKTTNPSKDIEFLFKGKWLMMEKIFPISVRELVSSVVCEEWNDRYKTYSDIEIYSDLLKKSYTSMCSH